MTADSGGPPGRIGRAIFSLSRWWAILGGLVLVALMLMTVVSVLMRLVLGYPVPGDFELVEMGTAVAAFAYLPYCQQTGGNVLVDFFTLRASERVKAGLAALSSLLLALFALVLLWRMTLGGIDFWRYHEETTNLGVPRWWPFPSILISLALLVLVSLATFAREVRVTAGRGPA